MGSLRLPPGFRFHPTDQELVEFYLKEKVEKRLSDDCVIVDVDLLAHEPWDLPSLSSLDEGEWYFFCPRDRKYPNGSRANRATEKGYWKATGKDKQVFSGKGKRQQARPGAQARQIGMKKTLVFYLGRAPNGSRTDWVMHEYHVEAEGSSRFRHGDYVLCRIFNKNLADAEEGAGDCSPPPQLPLPEDSAFTLECSAAEQGALVDEEAKTPGTSSEKALCCPVSLGTCIELRVPKAEEAERDWDQSHSWGSSQPESCNQSLARQVPEPEIGLADPGHWVDDLFAGVGPLSEEEQQLLEDFFPAEMDGPSSSAVLVASAGVPSGSPEGSDYTGLLEAGEAGVAFPGGWVESGAFGGRGGMGVLRGFGDSGWQNDAAAPPGQGYLPGTAVQPWPVQLSGVSLAGLGVPAMGMWGGQGLGSDYTDVGPVLGADVTAEDDPSRPSLPPGHDQVDNGLPPLAEVQELAREFAGEWEAAELSLPESADVADLIGSSAAPGVLEAPNAISAQALPWNGRESLRDIHSVGTAVDQSEGTALASSPRNGHVSALRTRRRPRTRARPRTGLGRHPSSFLSSSARALSSVPSFRLLSVEAVASPSLAGDTRGFLPEFQEALAVDAVMTGDHEGIVSSDSLQGLVGGDSEGRLFISEQARVASESLADGVQDLEERFSAGNGGEVYTRVIVAHGGAPGRVERVLVSREQQQQWQTEVGLSGSTAAVGEPAPVGSAASGVPLPPAAHLHSVLPAPSQTTLTTPVPNRVQFVDTPRSSCAAAVCSTHWLGDLSPSCAWIAQLRALVVSVQQCRRHVFFIGSVPLPVHMGVQGCGGNGGFLVTCSSVRFGLMQSGVGTEPRHGRLQQSLVIVGAIWVLEKGSPASVTLASALEASWCGGRWTAGRNVCASQEKGVPGGGVGFGLEGWGGLVTAFPVLRKRELYLPPQQITSLRLLLSCTMAPVALWGPIDWMVVGALAASALLAVGHALGFM